MNIYRKPEIPEHLQQYFEPAEIGLEETPEAYVAKLVAVFREVRRVLRDDGTLWLNLGDSYAATTKGSSGKGDKQITNKGTLIKDRSWSIPNGLKPKDLIGIPWRVAFALQADGYYLRQDIIWHKPNPMPESVKDRPTKSHEYVFLLSKSERYYFDQEAVKEELLESSIKRNQTSWNGNQDRGYVTGLQNHMSKYLVSDKAKLETHRNIRSVWTIPTHPYKEAHFATFPEKLVEPCIKAGCPKGGVVIDPFAGSGTTGVVTSKLDRKFIGIELNPKYFKMAEKRIYESSPLFADNYVIGG